MIRWIAPLLALTACTSESDRAKREVDIVMDARRTASRGREADNAEVCQAYTKLRAALLAEGRAGEYQKTSVFIDAYC